MTPTRRFSERLFGGLEYTASLGRQAGFELETAYTKDLFNLRAVAGPNSEAEVTFGILRGIAAETDEDLMHEELSRYNLDPSGYSGRVLGWSETAGPEVCQTFTVYRDGVWKTKGLFVNLARGKVDDPDEIINGFCLRILGRPHRPGRANRRRGPAVAGGVLYAHGTSGGQGVSDGAALPQIASTACAYSLRSRMLWTEWSESFSSMRCALSRVGRMFSLRLTPLMSRHILFATSLASSVDKSA